jgi:hypothetical protein
MAIMSMSMSDEEIIRYILEMKSPVSKPVISKNPMETRSKDLKKARIINMLIEIDDYDIFEILPLLTKFFGRFPLSNKDVMRGEVKASLTVMGYTLLQQNLEYRHVLFQGKHLMTRQKATQVNMKRWSLDKIIKCGIDDFERIKILIENNLHFQVLDNSDMDVDRVEQLIDLLIETKYSASAETPLKRKLFDTLIRLGYQNDLSDEEYDALTFKFYHIAKSLAVKLKNVHPRRCRMIQSYRKL